MPNFLHSHYRWVVVGVLWLVHAFGFMNFSSLGILAPFIKEDFQLTSVQIGFLISALSIGASLSQMPAGLISDFFGVRFMLALGVALEGFFFALLAYASSYPVALLILLFYGLASGIITPTTSKSVLDWFPTVGRATAMGIKQTGVNFGGILAGIIFPFFVLYFSWRQSLFTVGLVEMACAVFIYKFAKESPVKTPVPQSSLAWRKIFHIALHRDMLILGGIGFGFIASQYCFSAYLTLFLTKELDYSIRQAGHYFALSYFIGAAGRVFWSLLSDYLFEGRRKGILFLITFIMLLSSLALSLISFFPSLAQFLLPVILAFGISGIGWNAIYLTILGEAMGKESIGLATGAGYFFGFLGSLLCPPFFGYLIDRTGVYGYAWLFLACCAGTILFLLSLFAEANSKERVKNDL